MIVLHTQQSVDRSAWDQMIDESVNQSLFGQSWLLDIACSNWHALVLDDYEAGFVLPIKKRFGIRYAYNPLFIRECGVFSRNYLLPEVFEKFIKAIPRTIFSIDLFLNKTLGNGLFTPRGFQTLSLEQPIETIRKNYNENTRRNIRKAENQQFELVYGTDASVVTTMFLKNKLSEIKELNSSDETTLREMLQAAIDRNQGFTALVLKGEEIMASAGFMFHKQTLLYFKGSVTDIGRKLGAMHFLMDQVLDRYATKFKVFDFGGSNQSNVARFYRGFGGEDNVYYRYKKNWL